MSKSLWPLAAARALLALPCLAAAPALAAAPVTFVSGKGTDAGTCASPANPCRSFEFALGQTSPSGEIKALGPADYGSVTITKSVSITGVEGAGIDLDTATDAITINARADDTINLSHLTLDGLKTARSGIVLNSGGSLTITDCVVRNFEGAGVQLSPAANTAFLIQTTVVSDNGVGIGFSGQGTGSVQGTLDHVFVTENGDGVFVGARATVLAVNSTAADNASVGFVVFSGGILRLAHSAVTENLQGVIVVAGSMAESAGNNVIRGNGTDVDGTLTNVGTQ
jgi:hypothetical protein